MSDVEKYVSEHHTDRIIGFLPGGEDRPQWVFEVDGGEVWTEEMMEPLIDFVKQEVIAVRERFNNGMDLVNFWRFRYSELGPTSNVRIFTATRRNWRWSLQGIEGTTYDGVVHHGIEELLQEMNRYSQENGYLSL